MSDTKKDIWIILWNEFKKYHKKMAERNKKKYQIMSEEAAAILEAAINADTVTEAMVYELLAE